MTPTWTGAEEPTPQKITLAGLIRVVVRGTALAIILLTGVVSMFLARLIERPLCGVNRPATPYITQAVCRSALRIMGLTLKTQGPRIKGAGAIVANHASWLDIFVLNSRKNVYFVSKAEVAGWPGIGLLARITGTVFIRRDRREAKQQTQLFEERLMAGHRLLFFPEGTSTDSLRVLPFKSTLFAAFFSDALRHAMQIQPVTVEYYAPTDQDPRFYGWWGGMEFGAHLLQVLAVPKQGRVEITYHDPVRVDDFPNRKSLARHCEDQVRSAHKRSIN